MPVGTLTPVERYVTARGEYWCKREDHAGMYGYDFPRGSKMRQYMAMARLSPGAPMIVGCSADSCMQVYVAGAAKLAGVQGVIYTAQRKRRSEATQYALEMGAEVNEIPHGYLSVLRAHMKRHMVRTGLPYVRWQQVMALEDAAGQCGNIPREARRILIATGSGLTAAGVMVGMRRLGLQIPVVAYAVSQMATVEKIRALATAPEIPLEVVRCPLPYNRPVHANLPDGSILDPFYAAKALGSVQPGDLFWIPGVRPDRAMPQPKWGNRDGKLQQRVHGPETDV